MHRLATSFILGYHGCDAAVADKLTSGASFKNSQNSYDWLGDGIYFWEANPRRAMEFASVVAQRSGSRSTIRRPAVVGAVIDLRYCLDLSTSAGATELKDAYTSYAATMAEAGEVLPSNVGGSDRLLRRLDRAVIEHLHAVRALKGLPSFDTTRGFFFEGDHLYPGAGFFEKTHIQVCVRSLDCIHGVFKVPSYDL